MHQCLRGPLHDMFVCFEQAEEMAAWERAKEEERKKLQRERAVLSKQSRAMLKLPTRKDRAEVGLSHFTSNKLPCYTIDYFKCQSGQQLQGSVSVLAWQVRFKRC